MFLVLQTLGECWQIKEALFCIKYASKFVWKHFASREAHFCLRNNVSRRGLKGKHLGKHSASTTTFSNLPKGLKNAYSRFVRATCQAGLQLGELLTRRRVNTKIQRRWSTKRLVKFSLNNLVAEYLFASRNFPLDGILHCLFLPESSRTKENSASRVKLRLVENNLQWKRGFKSFATGRACFHAKRLYPLSLKLNITKACIPLGRILRVERNFNFFCPRANKPRKAPPG